QLVGDAPVRPRSIGRRPRTTRRMQADLAHTGRQMVEQAQEPALADGAAVMLAEEPIVRGDPGRAQHAPHQAKQRPMSGDVAQSVAEADTARRHAVNARARGSRTARTTYWGASAMSAPSTQGC